jgi:hypothetical protein
MVLMLRTILLLPLALPMASSAQYPPAPDGGSTTVTWRWIPIRREDAFPARQAWCLEGGITPAGLWDGIGVCLPRARLDDPPHQKSRVPRRVNRLWWSSTKY